MIRRPRAGRRANICGTELALGDYRYTELHDQRPAAPSDLVDRGCVASPASAFGLAVESVETLPASPVFSIMYCMGRLAPKGDGRAFLPSCLALAFWPVMELAGRAGVQRASHDADARSLLRAYACSAKAIEITNCDTSNMS
jgi:hypothetical protein